MDQLQTESSRLFGPKPLSDYTAWALGKVLAYPTSDIPTVEDWQREQGLAGVPTEDESATEVGRNTLDYLTMAHGLANLLKSGGAGVQELMGKQRGVETFGKEMMDTSRRAQPQKWKAMLEENLDPMERPMRSGYGSRLAPGETPPWRVGESKPADVVETGMWKSRLGDVQSFRIGEPVTLPGDRTAQYLVVPSGVGASIVLDSGGKHSVIFTTQSMGEALAKARQLQNRLTLAAKDLTRHTEAPIATESTRRFRLPWERSSSPDARQSGGETLPWRLDYQSPPQSGKWSQGATFYDE